MILLYTYTIYDKIQLGRGECRYGMKTTIDQVIGMFGTEAMSGSCRMGRRFSQTQKIIKLYFLPLVAATLLSRRGG